MSFLRIAGFAKPEDPDDMGNNDTTFHNDPIFRVIMHTNKLCWRRDSHANVQDCTQDVELTLDN